MGMYDYLRCHYPLPVEGANALEFQTKDTPAQFLDQYEINADGTLWREEYDIEDQSDPNAEGLMRLRGLATRVNRRWVQCPPHTGEIQFMGNEKEDLSGRWMRFSAYFVDGKLRDQIVQIED